MSDSDSQVVFQGKFDDEGLAIYRRTDVSSEIVDFSIPLAYSDDPSSLAGALDISESGELLGIELIGVKRAIEIVKESKSLDRSD